jgi:hypothetical protein
LQKFCPPRIKISNYLSFFNGWGYGLLKINNIVKIFGGYLKNK